MADTLGILGRMGIITGATTWNTVTYPGSATTIPFVSETLTSAFNRIEREQLVGYGGKLASMQGNEVIAGTTEHFLDYTQMHVLITAVMGNLAGGTPNTITIQDRHGDGSAKAYWIEIDKGHTQHRFGPAKPTKMTISGEKDAKIKIAVEWVCFGWASVGTGFTGGTWTPTTPMIFPQLVCRIADQVNVLVAGDAVGIDSFEITLDRGMKTDDYVADATYPRQPLIPVEDSFRQCQLKISIPRMASDAFGAWRDADTPLQADLKFTSGANYHTFQFRELRIADGFMGNIGGPDAIKLEGTFDAYRCADAGHPMGVGNELVVLYV